MKRKTALLCIGLVAPVAMMAQPAVNNSDAAGYLERGRLMVDARSYVGAIDQLTHMQTMPAGVDMTTQAEYLIALSRFERGEQGSWAALQQFIDAHPGSPLVPLAQMKQADYYFYRGEYSSAQYYYDEVPSTALDADAAEDLLYRKAYCNLRTGNYETAARQYDTLEKTKRYGAASQFYKAYIDYAEGDYNTARSKFSAIDPNGELGYQSQYYLTQMDYRESKYNQVITRGTNLLDDRSNDYFDAELNRIVGESYYHTGNETQASTYLRRYLDNPEGEPYRTAGYTMGVLDYKAGDYTAALNDMALATDGNDAIAQSALLYTGQCRLKQNDLNGAAMAFEQAAKMDASPEVKETAFYNYAITQNKGARTPFGQSIDLFEQFLNDYPNSRYRDNVEEYLVDAYVSGNDYNKALASINRIKNPGKRVLTAKQKVLYNLGVQALSSNDNSQATSYLSEAVKLGNLDSETLNESRLWLAEAQYRSGNYKAAAANQQAYVKSSSKGNDNYGIAQYNLGYSLFQQRNYSDAQKAFKNAVNSGKLSNELRADAYNRIGDTQYYTRDYSGAQQSYEQALVEDKGASRDYSMYQKGIMMGLNKKYDDEIKQMDALVKAYPNSQLVPQALLEKANALNSLNRNDEAVKAYSNVYKSYPKSNEARQALLQKAITQEGMHNVDGAIDSYKQVIQNYPTSEQATAAAEALNLIYADRGQLTQYEQWLNAIPGAPRLNVNERERLTFEAAEKAIIGDKPDVSRIEQYLQDYPNGTYASKATYYLARYHYGKGNYSTALTHIDNVLSQSKNTSYAEDAMAMRSDILLKQGKTSDALKSYQDLAEAATTDDNRLSARLGVMRTAQSLKQWKTVKSSADQLLATGGLTAAEEKEVNLAQAIALRETGDRKSAATALAKLAKDPNSEAGAQAAYELAQMQYDDGDYKSAERTVNALIDAGTPHSYWLARGFIVLSDVYTKQGKTTQAREYLQSLKSNYPGKEADIIEAINSRLNAKSATTTEKNAKSKKKSK